MIIEKNFN